VTAPSWSRWRCFLVVGLLARPICRLVLDSILDCLFGDVAPASHSKNFSIRRRTGLGF
jgi:hypothetical protein